MSAPGSQATRHTSARGVERDFLSLFSQSGKDASSKGAGSETQPTVVFAQMCGNSLSLSLSLSSRLAAWTARVSRLWRSLCDARWASPRASRRSESSSSRSAPSPRRPRARSSEGSRRRLNGLLRLEGFWRVLRRKRKKNERRCSLLSGPQAHALFAQRQDPQSALRLGTPPFFKEDSRVFISCRFFGRVQSKSRARVLVSSP